MLTRTVIGERLGRLGAEPSSDEIDQHVVRRRRCRTWTLEAVRAYTATLACDEFDLAALKQFRTNWFDDPYSRPAE